MTKEKLIVKSIQADVPTANGRIYPRAVLEKAIEEYQEKINSKRAMVFADSGNHPPPLTDYMGLVDKMELDEEGSIRVEITLNGPKYENIKKVLGQPQAAVTFVGTVNDDKTVDDLSISHTIVLPEEKKPTD